MQNAEQEKGASKSAASALSWLMPPTASCGMWSGRNPWQPSPRSRGRSLTGEQVAGCHVAPNQVEVLQAALRQHVVHINHRATCSRSCRHCNCEVRRQPAEDSSSGTGCEVHLQRRGSCVSVCCHRSCVLKAVHLLDGAADHCHQLAAIAIAAPAVERRPCSRLLPPLAPCEDRAPA